MLQRLLKLLILSTTNVAQQRSVVIALIVHSIIKDLVMRTQFSHLSLIDQVSFPRRLWQKLQVQATILLVLHKQQLAHRLPLKGILKIFQLL